MPYDGVGVECAQDATSAIRRVPLWGLFPNWLVELAGTALRRNPLRQRLHAWLSLGAGVSDIQFVHYILMHGTPIAPQHAWPEPVTVPPNHGSSSADNAKVRVQQQLVEEVDSGKLLRFSGTRVSQLQSYGFLSHIHPMGAVPKFDTLSCSV
jgi:hypothetical protein